MIGFPWIQFPDVLDAHTRYFYPYLNLKKLTFKWHIILIKNFTEFWTSPKSQFQFRYIKSSSYHLDHLLDFARCSDRLRHPAAASLLSRSLNYGEQFLVHSLGWRLGNRRHHGLTLDRVGGDGRRGYWSHLRVQIPHWLYAVRRGQLCGIRRLLWPLLATWHALPASTLGLQLAQLWLADTERRSAQIWGRDFELRAARLLAQFGWFGGGGGCGCCELGCGRHCGRCCFI